MSYLVVASSKQCWIPNAMKSERNQNVLDQLCYSRASHYLEALQQAYSREDDSNSEDDDDKEDIFFSEDEEEDDVRSGHSV